MKEKTKKRMRMLGLMALLVFVSLAYIWKTWLDPRVRAVAHIENLGGRVFVDAEKQKDQVVSVVFTFRPLTDGDLHGLKDDLHHLNDANRFQRLFLDNTKITDAGLEDLSALTQLEVLSLKGSAITDAGLQKLKGLTALRRLIVIGAPVTDGGVKELQQALPQVAIITEQERGAPGPASEDD